MEVWRGWLRLDRGMAGGEVYIVYNICFEALKVSCRCDWVFLVEYPNGI